MDIENIRNRNQFIRFMRPYGNHVKFIVGNYYTIRIINITFDEYEIERYDEAYYKEDSKRKYLGYPSVETIRTNAAECVNLIILEFRKEKINKIKEKWKTNL